MDMAGKALALVRSLAQTTTPEEEFEANKNEDGFMVKDEITYDDVDEMVSDMDDDTLMDAYGEYMDFVRAAKEIIAEEEEKDAG